MVLRREICAGLLLAALGVAGVAMAFGHRIGTGSNMGPGFFPLILGGIMLAVGAIVLGQAILTDPGEILSGFEWRPMLVLLAMVVFAYAVRPLGFVIAGFVVIVMSGLAHPDNRPLSLAVLAAVLVICSWLVFIHFLGAPMHPWWRF
jgi:Tripartite tricarboxylate transporter TctB family